MILYHATTDSLRLGETLTAEKPTPFYPDVVAELEQARPRGAPSRSCCLFAADSLLAVTSFMRAQGVADFNVYEVEMDLDEVWKSPFCLVNEISCRIRKCAAFQAVVKEYWEPTHDWHFWEYFSPKLKVKREVSERCDLISSAGFHDSYRADVALAKSLSH